MKVYISGPIKDNEDYETDFFIAETNLKTQQFEVVSPVKLDHPPDSTYEEYMRADINALLWCDAIYMLKGWERSQGAKIEFLVATACGMLVMYQ